MKWFRLYSEFATDPKIQIVTEALQRRYVMLLCLHNTGNYENSPDDEIALALRVTIEEWQSSRKELIQRKLLDGSGKIIGWEKRQYISDLTDPTASERQKRYRKNKKSHRNTSVMSRLPEADTEADTEKNKGGARLKDFLLKELPEVSEAKQIDFMPDAFSELWNTKHGENDDKLFVEWEKFVTYFAGADAKRPIKKDWLGAWRNWITK